ncbi:outer membrane protein OmpA-like peptidoglycan-associated protein [Micromonospora luteifusca]|uniref:Outer membrane protein OmpA-like peptidoglycan-associated protein n=1 Tax=Micromonospora luteifusca TaxID=709860 RepID=A0ABS2LLE8_9ACTN|nr:OmpA family protein [Micromonospora luteifusca]MBM7488797.1 outer membrane protein OmpA-like peptidoglycan-associated protein [Micromonospora luteifusca]
MFRSVNRPHRPVAVTIVAGLVLLVPAPAGAAPGGTAGAPTTVVDGPRPGADGGQVTTPVVDVVAPAVDVFVVTGSVEGDSTEAESFDRVELTLGADVLFAFGKADLSPAAHQRLAQIAERIRQQAKGVVRIDGHTDAIGDPADNQESEPIATETTPDGRDNPAGRAKNRRVEIRFDK